MKRGTRFEARGNDSAEIDVGCVKGCSDDGLDAEAVGDIDSDMLLSCPCSWGGGEVCGVMALASGSCFEVAVASIEGSREQESRGVRGGE